MLKPSGSWVAICTPFNRDESIDFAGFKTLVEFQARWGSNGILVMGSTGEATLLSPEERRQIIDRVVGYARDARIPAFFGCTCLTTKDTVDLARHAEAAGADGILLVVPPYVAPPPCPTRPAGAACWPCAGGCPPGGCAVLLPDPDRRPARIGLPLSPGEASGIARLSSSEKAKRIRSPAESPEATSAHSVPMAPS